MRALGSSDRSATPERSPAVEVVALAEAADRRLACAGSRFHLQTWTFACGDSGPSLATTRTPIEGLELAPDATHFGFVASGRLTLEHDAGSFDLASGMYFAAPGGTRLLPSTSEGARPGAGFAVSWLGGSGLFHLGGPIEARGRLRYLDGCSDTLLIPPTLRGDPCLNLLHVPEDTRQTEHTHPSFRVGLVAEGRGRCRTPEGEHALAPGSLFSIPAGARHCFWTGDEALRILAFHPDSDFGPTDDDHPMWNRTLGLRCEEDAS